MSSSTVTSWTYVITLSEQYRLLIRFSNALPIVILTHWFLTLTIVSVQIKKFLYKLSYLLNVKLQFNCRIYF